MGITLGDQARWGFKAVLAGEEYFPGQLLALPLQCVKGSVLPVKPRHLYKLDKRGYHLSISRLEKFEHIDSFLKRTVHLVNIQKALALVGCDYMPGIVENGTREIIA